MYSTVCFKNHDMQHEKKIWLKFIPINKIFKTAKQIANKMDSTINYPTTRHKT